jgi:hypothetical protein
MSVIGACKLCLRLDRELRDSHFMPRALYALLRTAERKNANPVVISHVRARTTSAQARDYVFCGTCEQRLSTHGESWVMAHGSRKHEGFLLRDALRSVPPIWPDADLLVYRAAEIPAIDVPKLIYFAASVFWRASIHEWEIEGERASSICLGPRYEELLRRYLLGEAEFPENACLWVSVVRGDHVFPALYPPVGAKKNNYWEYRFVIPGIMFHMCVGGQMRSNEIRKLCTLRSEGNLIYSSEKVDQGIIESMRSLIGEARPTGSLLKLRKQA